MTTPSDALIDGFLSYIKRIRCLSGETVVLYALACRHWAAFAASRGITDLLSAGAGVFLEWMEHRKAVHRVSDRTIESQVYALRAFYDYVRIFHGVISPILELPAYCAAPSPEQGHLCVTEARALLRACRGRRIIDKRNYLAVALLWSTGLRSRELCSLTWQDVDLVNGILLVRKGKGNKQRQLFINHRLLRLFSEYRRALLPHERAPVFAAQRAGAPRLSVRSLGDIVRLAARNAGITRPVKPITLRHTFATHLYEAGVPVHDIKEMMGHDTKSETGIYIHITLEAMRGVLSRHAAIRFLKDGTEP